MKHALTAVLEGILLLGSVLTAEGSFELGVPSTPAAGALNVLPDHGLVTLATRNGSGSRMILSAAEHYGLSEARSLAVGATFTAGDGELALCGLSMGSSLYREQSLGIGWRAPLGEGGVICLRANAMGITADGLESRWAVTLDPQMLWLLRGRVAVELSLSNATGASIRGSPVSSRTSGKLALVLDDAVLGLAVESERGFPLAFGMGLELEATDRFRLRAGGGTEPGRLAIGFGIGARDLGRPVVDIAWQWHPRLGGSTFVSISLGL